MGTIQDLYNFMKAAFRKKVVKIGAKCYTKDDCIVFEPTDNVVSFQIKNTGCNTVLNYKIDGCDIEILPGYTQSFSQPNHRVYCLKLNIKINSLSAEQQITDCDGNAIEELKQFKVIKEFIC